MVGMNVKVAIMEGGTRSNYSLTVTTSFAFPISEVCSFTNGIVGMS